LPEPAIHFSLVFAIFAPILGLRRAFLISLLTLIPDIDVIFHIHRSMTHSVILISLTYLPILLLVYFFKREFLNVTFMGFLSLLIHPIMDCFQTYTPILYPLSPSSLWFDVDGGIQISGRGIYPSLSLGLRFRPTSFRHFIVLDAPIFTGEGLLISILLIASTAFTRMRPPSPSDKGETARSVGSNILKVDADSPPGLGIGVDDITVVLPTLNEEEAVGKVIDELRGEGFNKILVVDGYSSDGTVDIAKEKGVRVVFQRGSGKAGAIRTALEVVETPYMVVMDADYTYDPGDIKRLLSYAPGYDEVIGLRSDRGNIPLLHRFGNRVISFVISLLMGRRISDPCSGMYLLRVDRARRLELTSSGFDVEVEIAAQICSNGRICEVPISYRRRLGRRKLSSFRDGLRIIMTAFRVAWMYNPIFIFSSIAALLSIPGALILLQQLYLRYVHGAARWSVGWAWLGLLLLVIGLQGFTISTISLLLKRLERRILEGVKSRI